MSLGQSDYDIRCEWGERGLLALRDGCDCLVVVDVLSFSTCVDIATARGATIFPYRWSDDSARNFAKQAGATLAGPRATSRYSLSPVSYVDVPRGVRIVLPSPNGSSLSHASGGTPTLTGCLRNAAAVGSAARDLGQRVALIPAGERWPGGSLRPCLEDWLGVGAIIAHLSGRPSPEAAAAAAAFRACKRNLRTLVRDCLSGRELVERGYESDVALASELNVSACVPQLARGAFVDVRSQQLRVAW
jgi:2-phosphosulfolactate phosphatase